MGFGSIRNATGDELVVTDAAGRTLVVPQDMRDTAERVLGLDPASVAARERAARRATTATRRRWLVDDRGNQPAEHLRAVHAALLHRAVPSRYAAPTEATARPWLDCSMIDMARDLLTLAGDPDPEWGPADGSDTFAPGATPRGRDRLASAWLFDRQGRYGFKPLSREAGFISTSDLPGILDGVARRIFLDAYDGTVKSFEPWTTPVTVADFKSTVVSDFRFPALLEVPEHGEYVAGGGPFGADAPIRVTTFGRIVQFTRRAILRDDAASLGLLLQALGVAAAHVEADVVYDLLASNPTLPDGQPLFSAAHGNLMSPGALDATTLAAACTVLAAISNHARPSFVVCGTQDGATARQLVAAETPANAVSGDASGTLTVVVDDRIPSGFYVVSDPAELATIAVAHLAGSDGPELRVREGWDIDARLYKGRTEFGAAAVNATAMVFTPAS